jgi:hypothetical protein
MRQMLSAISLRARLDVGCSRLLFQAHRDRVEPRHRSFNVTAVQRIDLALIIIPAVARLVQTQARDINVLLQGRQMSPDDEIPPRFHESSHQS